VAVFAGGVAGALCRAGLDRAFPPAAHGWPWPTFAANVVGALALVVFATRLQERLLRRCSSVPCSAPASAARSRPSRRSSSGRTASSRWGRSSSLLIAVVVLSAIVPTAIAQRRFDPRARDLDLTAPVPPAPVRVRPAEE